MATHILETERPVLLSRSPDAYADNQCDTSIKLPEQGGNIVRAFLYSMLLNLILLVAFVFAWELWRLTR